MKLAKLAVAYYVETTGNDWSQFYTDLDEALRGSLDDQTGDLWLIHSLVNTLVKNDISVEQFKMSKDVIKSFFDEEDRKLKGEFYTPICWAEELHSYMDKYIPNWRTEMNVWENSFGSANLIRTARITPDHLFASSIQQADVDAALKMPELQGAHIFQLDFLKACDDGLSNEFLHTLPKKLQEVISKDEPLVFLCNPPYKTGQANATQVGKFMNDKNGLAIYDWADFSKPSYDLFYQFCFQVMNMVASDGGIEGV